MVSKILCPSQRAFVPLAGIGIRPAGVFLEGRFSKWSERRSCSLAESPLLLTAVNRPPESKVKAPRTQKPPDKIR
jgi:hypothetical protein